ncbi:MAG: hypothetical protein HQ582_13265 [Planctomycetes bacterium]|nr:hypothetical protein [Planctomycetota bacterium]
MIRLFEPTTDEAAGLDAPFCHVEIDNQILGTRQSFTLPVDPDEAMNTCLPVAQAAAFISWHGVDVGEPLEVAIQQQENSITVRWFVAEGADPEAARERLKEALDGEKGGAV